MIPSRILLIRDFLTLDKHFKNNIMKKKSFFSILLLISIIVFSGCKKGDKPAPFAPGLPTLTNTAVISITNTTVQSGGYITADGGAAVTARGVCWSTAANPTTSNSKTTDGTGIGIFNSYVIGLTAGATYYVRAYATNSAGTAYGNERSFTTTTAGKDVYIAGFEYNGSKRVAKVWKNGVASLLTNGSNDASASSVYVSDTDVYVAGYETSGIKEVAKVWKNGVATSLTNGSNDARANSVYVSGTDVYVAGREHNGTKYVAIVWKTVWLPH